MKVKNVFLCDGSVEVHAFRRESVILVFNRNNEYYKVELTKDDAITLCSAILEACTMIDRDKECENM